MHRARFYCFTFLYFLYGSVWILFVLTIIENTYEYIVFQLRLEKVFRSFQVDFFSEH